MASVLLTIIPCSRATAAAAAHSRFRIESRPRRIFLQRSNPPLFHTEQLLMA